MVKFLDQGSGYTGVVSFLNGYPITGRLHDIGLEVLVYWHHQDTKLGKYAISEIRRSEFHVVNEEIAIQNRVEYSGFKLLSIEVLSISKLWVKQLILENKFSDENTCRFWDAT